jgi:alanine dehydrogenase
VFDRLEMEGEMRKISLDNEKIIVTGNGRVGNGVMEIMKKSGVKEVSKNEFLENSFDVAVFVHLNTMDYNIRKDGSDSDKHEFYNNPELYKSSFMQYAKKADIFIAGHYYSADSPFLFTREDAKSNDFSLKVVADISCDIDGPVASTIKPSTISNPIYGYNPETGLEIVEGFIVDATGPSISQEISATTFKLKSLDFASSLVNKKGESAL